MNIEKEMTFTELTKERAGYWAEKLTPYFRDAQVIAEVLPRGKTGKWYLRTFFYNGYTTTAFCLWTEEECSRYCDYITSLANYYDFLDSADDERYEMGILRDKLEMICRARIAKFQPKKKEDPYAEEDK